MSKSGIEPFDGGDDTPLAPPPDEGGSPTPPQAPPEPRPTLTMPKPPEADPAPQADDIPPFEPVDENKPPEPIVPAPKPSVWKDELLERGFKKDGFSEDDSDYIDEARKNGWTPPENFKGNAAGYVGPKKFVEQDRKSPAAVRRENSELGQQVERLNQNLEQQRVAAEREKAAAVNRAYTQAWGDINDRKAKAWQAGDAKAMAAADQDMINLLKHKAEHDVKAQAAVESVPQEMPDFVKTWQAENTWYGPEGDPEKTAYAESQVDYYQSQGYTKAALLKAVGDAVAREFPDDDAKPQKADVPAAQGFRPQGGAEAPRAAAQQVATISQYDANVQGAFADFYEEHGPGGTGMYADKAVAEKTFLGMMKGW